eukprot:TRINITY_DN26027_c0_g2_i1.p1 TRINITY_DN26027_c0_g2~~TRINITY_DN26027_c0_g2_i1.p1  ORF type:complete len:419 (-),score=38.61 TRINITY_DN26027_c0_g2_i1:182-1438(-)
MTLLLFLLIQLQHAIAARKCQTQPVPDTTAANYTDRFRTRLHLAEHLRRRLESSVRLERKLAHSDTLAEVNATELLAQVEDVAQAALKSLRLNEDLRRRLKVSVKLVRPLSRGAYIDQTCCNKLGHCSIDFKIDLEIQGKTDEIRDVTCVEMYAVAPLVDAAVCDQLWRHGCWNGKKFVCQSAISWLGSVNIERPCEMNTAMTSQFVNAVVSTEAKTFKYQKWLFPAWVLSDQAAGACCYHDDGGDVSWLDHGPGSLTLLTAVKYGTSYYGKYYGFHKVELSNPFKVHAATVEKFTRLRELGNMYVQDARHCLDESEHGGKTLNDIMLLLPPDSRNESEIKMVDALREVSQRGRTSRDALSASECIAIEDFYYGFESNLFSRHNNVGCPHPIEIVAPTIDVRFLPQNESNETESALVK